MKKGMYLIIILVFSLVGCGAKNSNVALTNYVKEKVSEGLKKPESATFCEEDQFIIEELDHGKFNVSGYCEGQNSYGAMVGNGFNLIVTENENGEFSSTDVSFMTANEWNTKRKLEDEKEERLKNGEKLLTAHELENALVSQDYYIEKTKIEKKEDLYLATGDMIKAVIKNQSDKTIKNAVVAFVGWDSNGYAVKLQGSVDITDGAYVKEVYYDGINLEPNMTLSDDYGYEIKDKLSVKNIKAIVVSVETVDGNKWENPYYIDFVEAYENKEFTE